MKYLLTLVVVLALMACGQQKKAEKSEPTTQTQEQMAQAKFAVADLAVDKCPGCGMTFKMDKDIADTLHYQGKVYGFCGEKCANAFKADPEKTLAAMNKKMEGMHEHGEEHN